MRDLILTLLVLGLLPYALLRPQVGIYAWSWLSYMNPHRFTYGFAYSFPFAQSVAVATLIGILFWKQPKRIPMTGLTVVWIFFVLWMLITTVFSMYPDHAWEQYVRVVKIQLVTFLTMMVIKNRKDLDVLIWVIALSIGFFGIKGGVFTIATLGGHRVWGPGGSFIEENNALAVALLMVLPLFYYLRLQAKRKILRHVLLICMLLMVASIIGSQSRGALLAISATGVFLWLKTPNKLITGFLLVILAAGVVSFMPSSWHERMGTIANYEEDASAMGRIAAWSMSINVANENVLGGGFNLWKSTTYKLYSDNPEDWDRYTAAHSIYFNVIAEHGWIGLLLFVTVFMIAWRTSSKITKQARGSPELKWAVDLMRMLQVSLIAYGTGGAFLQLSYFDLPWHMVSVIVITRFIVEQQLQDKGQIPHEQVIMAK